MPGNFPTPDFFFFISLCLHIHFIHVFIYKYLFSLLSGISVGTSYIYTSTYLYFTDAQQVAAHAHFLKEIPSVIQYLWIISLFKGEKWHEDREVLEHMGFSSYR